MLEKALEKFLQSDELKGAIAKSTTTGYYAGDDYKVELFPDGNYRVLWSGQIGNLYNSRGIILAIPTIPDDYNEDGSDEEMAWEIALDYYADIFSETMRNEFAARAERAADER